MESSKVTKILTILVNILFSLLSVGVCIYGVLLLFELNYITELRKFEYVQLDKTIYWPELVNWLYIAIGAATAIVNCSCIYVTKNKGLLVASCISLAISVIALVSLAVVTLVMCQTKTENYLYKNMLSVLNEAKTKDKALQRFHDIEDYYRCCGVRKITDYRDILEYTADQLNGLCCDNNKDVNTCFDTAESRLGCQKVVSSKFYDKYVGGTALCSLTAVVGLVDLILNCILLRIRNKNTVNTSYIKATKTTQQ